ncbi:MAG: radical SAM/SPASM domain-containing protein [Myxococcota bacterium]
MSAAELEVDARRLRDVREGRLSSGPETLQVNLGHACNLNCIFCWNHSPLMPRRSRRWHRERLSERHARNVADSLASLRPDRLMLSGQGEPLMQRSAPLLLRAAREAGIPVIVQTNGVGGVSVADLAGVERLMVNLSAATQAGYEASHPGRGALLHRVVERLLALERQRRSGGGPAVTLMAVVQRRNLEEMEPLVALAARVGASAVHFKGMEMVSGLECLALGEKDRATAWERLATAEERGRQLGVQVHAAHLRQVLRSEEPRRFTEDLAGTPCVMGWYYLRVTCDGRVMFCCKDKLVGHLDEAPLYRLWRSPSYHLHRLAGRDGGADSELFDDKCRACSNFERNQRVLERVGEPVRKQAT